MGKITVRKFRGYNDFKYGSFQVYVTEHEAIIRGILKKTDNYSPYLLVREVQWVIFLMIWVKLFVGLSKEVEKLKQVTVLVRLSVGFGGIWKDEHVFNNYDNNNITCYHLYSL